MCLFQMPHPCSTKRVLQAKKEEREVPAHTWGLLGWLAQADSRAGAQQLNNLWIHGPTDMVMRAAERRQKLLLGQSGKVAGKRRGGLKGLGEHAWMEQGGQAGKQNWSGDAEWVGASRGQGQAQAVSRGSEGVSGGGRQGCLW